MYRNTTYPPQFAIRTSTKVDILRNEANKSFAVNTSSDQRKRIEGAEGNDVDGDGRVATQFRLRGAFWIPGCGSTGFQQSVRFPR